MGSCWKKTIATLLAIVLFLCCAPTVSAAEAAPDIQTVPSLSGEVTVSPLLRVAGPAPGDTTDYQTTLEAAAEILRAGFVAREPVVTVGYTTKNYDEQLMYDVLDLAYAHTGVPTEGDYLRWHLGECQIALNGYVVGDTYYLILRYTPEYYTSALQEAYMDRKVKDFLDELNVYQATDYEKVSAIYDAICENVTYDHLGLALGISKLPYTAYSALVLEKAVCQGYSSLFYRLALELGVDARLIAGRGNNEDHGWNIVKLQGKYYNVDTTWDTTQRQFGLPYQHFLRGTENFTDHVAGSEYRTAAFLAAYPLSEADFSPEVSPTPGDIDGNEAVTSDDVVQLLLHISLPGMFPIDADADFTGDGAVTSDDVIQLLLHLSLPELFPLTKS